jgi:hypothetical protein
MAINEVSTDREIAPAQLGDTAEKKFSTVRESTWGSNAEPFPRTVTDTASTHLPRGFNLAEDGRPAGNPTQLAELGDQASATVVARRGDQGLSTNAGSDKKLAPIADALINQAERQYQKGYGCFVPRSGSQYSRKDTPPELGCASCMSNLMVDAHKEIGKPINYRQMHEVGVNRWEEKYTQAGLIHRVSSPQSGDFIVVKNNPSVSHPHMGLLSKEDGRMMVYHNQSGRMVKEPLDQSKFLHGYRQTTYYRPN